jgi:hypothetical protein
MFIFINIKSKGAVMRRKGKGSCSLYFGLLSIIFLSSLLSAGGDAEPVYEEVEVAEVIEGGGETSVGVFVGSRGVGADYSRKLGSVPNSAMKFSVSGLSGVSPSFDDGEVNYESDVNFINIGATLDYHPFNNGFFLSAGGFYSGNSIDLKATPTDGVYTINGNSYSSSDIDYIKGSTDFSSFVPYLGMGYDNSLFGSGNWFLTAKAGLIYQGSPNVKLDYQCGATATQAVCDQLKNDVAIAQDSINDELDKYQIHPDLSVGIAYRF